MPPDIAKRDSVSPAPGKRDAWTALLAGLVAVLAYALRLPAGFALGDGPELAAAAETLGTAHPPGYPLYCQLGRLASALVGDAQAGLRWLSLLCIGAAVSFSYLTLRRLTKSSVVTLTCSLAMAGSYLFVHNALFVEVYGPALLGLTATLWSLTRCIQDEPEQGRILTLALCYGLALGHHLTLLAFVPLVIYAVVRYARFTRPAFRFYVLWAALTFLGVSVFLYPPLRTAAGSPISWFKPDTLENLLHVVSGGSYADIWGVSGAQFWSNAGSLGGYILGQWPLYLIIAAVGGIVILWRRNRLFTIGLLLVVVLDFIWASGYAAYDIEVFLLPTAALLLFFASTAFGRGLEWLIARTSSDVWRGIGKTTAVILGLVLFIVGLGLYATPDDPDARPHGSNLLRAAPAESAVLFNGDLAFPALEAHYARDRRPDIILADEGGYMLHPLMQGEIKARLRDGAALYYLDPPGQAPSMPGCRSGYGYLYPATILDAWPYLEPVDGGGILAAEVAVRYQLARLESAPSVMRNDIEAQLIERAVGLAEPSPHAHLAIGLYLLENDPVAAEASFRRAVELSPWWPSAHFDLALTLIKQNRHPEAVAELRNALEGFGEDEVKTRAANLLRDIGE